MRFLIWGNGFPLLWPAPQHRAGPPAPSLRSPPSSHSRFLLFLSRLKASFEVTSVLHRFYAKASLRPLVSRALPAIFGLNACVANVEIRTVMRPPIPNRTAGGQVGKGRGNAPCPGSTEYGVRGPRHPHPPRSSWLWASPWPPCVGSSLPGVAHQHPLPVGVLSASRRGCCWGDKGRLRGEPGAPPPVRQG